MPTCLPSARIFVGRSLACFVCREGDFLFVGPDVFDQLEDAMRDVQLPEYLANSRFHKGSYEGLRAWGICQLVRLGAAPAAAACWDCCWRCCA